jgi:hypothetical protein
MMAALLFTVPFLQIFTIPAAYVGGVLLFRRTDPTLPVTGPPPPALHPPAAPPPAPWPAQPLTHDAPHPPAHGSPQPPAPWPGQPRPPAPGSP